MFPGSYTQVQQLAMVHQAIQVGAVASGDAEKTLTPLFKQYTSFTFLDLAKQATELAELVRRLRLNRNVLQALVSGEAAETRDVQAAAAVWMQAVERGLTILKVHKHPLLGKVERIVKGVRDQTSHIAAWDAVDQVILGLAKIGVGAADLGLSDAWFGEGAKLTTAYHREIIDQHRTAGDREHATYTLHDALEALFNLLVTLESSVDTIESITGKPCPGLHFGIVRAAFARARPTDRVEEPPADLEERPIPVPAPAATERVDGLPPVEPAGS